MVKASTQYKRAHKADYGRERLEVLFEDQWLIVVNKASGMLSVPYPGSRARTALEVLEQLLRQRGTLSRQRHPCAVHRLDRDTSGVMLFALTETAQQKIMDTWHTMVTERLYRAVAENPRDKRRTLADSGLIDAPLAFNAHTMGYVPRADERVQTVTARTNYRVLARGITHTLFELSLDTGRKNQIRAHLAANGYPLAGDENYRAATDPFHRLALHARTLAFTHPFTGAALRFEVPEPADWLPYVQRGDSAPEPPVWKIPQHRHDKKTRTSAKHGNEYSRRQNATDAVALGDRRMSRKEEAHLNYIERGKRRR